MEIYKIPQSSMNRINFMVKQQTILIGIKLSDRQYVIDRAISTEVIESLNDDQ